MDIAALAVKPVSIPVSGNDWPLDVKAPEWWFPIQLYAPGVSLNPR